MIHHMKSNYCNTPKYQNKRLKFMGLSQRCRKFLTKFTLMVVPVIKLRIQVYYLNIVKKKKNPKNKKLWACAGKAHS